MIVSTLRGHVGPVSNAVSDREGSAIATTGVDGAVRLWDAATGAPHVVLPGHDIASLAAVFTNSGATVTTWDEMAWDALGAGHRQPDLHRRT